MDINAVESFRLSPTVHRFAAKDSILYALGLGFGERPTDPAHLQFVYEKGLKAVPSAVVVLAHPGFWVNAPALKIDWIKILHGEQSFEILRPLPAEGVVRGEYAILAAEDKGPEKGAVLHVLKRLFDGSSGELLANVRSVYMLRGDGGHGGFGSAPPPPPPIPEGPADISIDLRTLPQSALIYRLSGDLNPIHADPAAAARAGFPQPILHGLCSMGLATRALIETVCEGDPTRLRSVSLRFSKPVFPGETLRIELFETGTGLRFRALAVERHVVVLDRGSAVVTRGSST
jgi:acyl dehydratase